MQQPGAAAKLAEFQKIESWHQRQFIEGVGQEHSPAIPRVEDRPARIRELKITVDNRRTVERKPSGVCPSGSFQVMRRRGEGLMFCPSGSSRRPSSRSSNGVPSRS
jgi:hypothetical protein